MCDDIFPRKLQQTYPLMVVISGPSGIGKDATVKMMEQRDRSFHFVVTATSRTPRPEEIDGEDYVFVSKERFEEMIRNGELIEYALVYGQYKGIPRIHVEQAMAGGTDVIMRLDVQGAKRIRNLFPEAILIFLIPSNDEEWCQRLLKRKSETPENLKLRIDTAHEEVKAIPMFDYLVVNADDKLDETVDTIFSIIHAEHRRTQHRRVSL